MKDTFHIKTMFKTYRVHVTCPKEARESVLEALGSNNDIDHPTEGANGVYCDVFVSLADEKAAEKLVADIMADVMVPNA